MVGDSNRTSRRTGSGLLAIGGFIRPARQVRGRGFVTADAVYLPTQSCLKIVIILFDRCDRQARSRKNGWGRSGKEDPGNVIVTQDHVVVAGNAQIAVYTDIELRADSWIREIADAPADADARLHYAEVMFAGRKRILPRRGSKRRFNFWAVHNRCGRGRAGSGRLTIVRLRKAIGPKERNPQQIDQFFDLAQAAAVTASQQVQYRMRGRISIGTRPTRNAGAAIEFIRKSWVIRRIEQCRCPTR